MHDIQQEMQHVRARAMCCGQMFGGTTHLVASITQATNKLDNNTIIGLVE